MIVHILLDNGADPNVKDVKEETALHHAFSLDKPEIAIGLLEFGGNLEDAKKPGLGPVTIGDLKTSDFDDLLAAFGIPDIDANEVTHSEPAENEGPRGQGKPEPSVGDDSEDRAVRATTEHDLLSPAEASQYVLPKPLDTSTVSIILKNTLCPEQSETLTRNWGEETNTGNVTKEGPVGSCLMQNGYGGPEPSLSEPPHSPAPAIGDWKKKSMEGKTPLDFFAHFGSEPEGHPDPLPSEPSPPRVSGMAPPPFSTCFELTPENDSALLPPSFPLPEGALKQESCSPHHSLSQTQRSSGSSPEAAGIPASASPPQMAGMSFKQSPGHQSPPASPGKASSCKSLMEEEATVDKSPTRCPQSPFSVAKASEEDNNDSPDS
ncbi:zinc finger protein 687 [Sigmodon hispidus]